MTVAARDLLAHAACEPAFGLDRDRSLHAAQRWDGRAAGDFLAHALVRSPAHLLMHVQRVTLWAQARESAETYGALLDLFIGLGAHGVALRARLLALARDVLAADARAFLDAHLATGVAANDAHPPATCSVLTRAVAGALDAVREDAVARDAPAYDVIAEAHDTLLAGDVAAARELLERALLADPGRADVAAELLGLYTHLRDAEHLQETRVALGERLADAAAWDAALRAIQAAPR